MLSSDNGRSPLQLVNNRVKYVRKSYPTFVNKNFKYATQWLVNRYQIQVWQ